jgi:hypothetical protein
MAAELLRNRTESEISHNLALSIAEQRLYRFSRNAIASFTQEIIFGEGTTINISWR